MVHRNIMDIMKLFSDSDNMYIQKYEFDMVTDEDVEVPDLSQYNVEIKEN